MNYKKPSGAFDYVFNAFGIWHSHDMQDEALARVFSKSEEPTEEFPAPRLSAQQDAYLDTTRRIHVLYRIQGQSTGGMAASRHAVISLDGEILHDDRLPSDLGSYSRVVQAGGGAFYILGSAGSVYPMDPENFLLDEPFHLDLGFDLVEYSGFGVSAPRTGTSLSEQIDVVYPSRGGSRWSYFRLDFSSQ